MRLDVDVIERLKRNGRGYQTQAKRLLREEMLRSYRKKAAQSENLREHPWTPLNPVGLRYFPQFWSGSWL